MVNIENQSSVDKLSTEHRHFLARVSGLRVMPTNYPHYHGLWKCQWSKAVWQDATRPVNHCIVVLGVGVSADSVQNSCAQRACSSFFTACGCPMQVSQKTGVSPVKMCSHTWGGLGGCTESAETPTPRTTIQWFTGLVASCHTALDH